MTEQAPIFEKPTNDYLRVMTTSLEVAIADPKVNTERILLAYQEAKAEQAEVLTLPELSITGYSTADLFFNSHVREQTEAALTTLAEATNSGPALVVGAPIEEAGVLYNCGVVLAEGKIVGAVPKSHLPNYNEFYEQRWFTSGEDITNETISIGGQEVPFGTDLLFTINGTKVALEICEDAYAPIPPSAYHALAGAELIINLSASNELIGKRDYRRQLVSGLAARLLCAYAYTSAGKGESDADVIYGGHQMISEAGKLHGEILPLSTEETTLVCDIDTAYLAHDRLVNKTYGAQAAKFRKQNKYRTLPITVAKPTDDRLLRPMHARPFEPKNQEVLDQRCEELFAMMAHPLAQRIQQKDTQGIVIGLSGGLDSTLALLTAAYACELLGKSNSFIHTITMPGPASSERTQDNASLLAEALGTTHKIAPIGDLTREALEAIGHDGVTEDIAYENTQARMRKLLLMNYANSIRGLDLGTGDLSENAQGWCTYNGDHMSMFNPNGGVPKTLVRHLVQWFADRRADKPAQKILHDIIGTPVSPELTGTGDLSQATEDILGPYELHDYFLTEAKRHGTRPEKIGYLATKAYEGTYSETEIDKWLQSYLKRFTHSQWKREVMPNGPKLGTVALSPRGDHRMAPNTSRTWYN